MGQPALAGCCGGELGVGGLGVARPPDQEVGPEHKCVSDHSHSRALWKTVRSYKVIRWRAVGWEGPGRAQRK